MTSQLFGLTLFLGVFNLATKVLDDSAEDIEKLYDALKKNNKNEATILLTHLVKVHKLTRKIVEARIKVIGAEKIGRVSAEN